MCSDKLQTWYKCGARNELINILNTRAYCWYNALLHLPPPKAVLMTVLVKNELCDWLMTSD